MGLGFGRFYSGNTEEMVDIAGGCSHQACREGGVEDLLYIFAKVDIGRVGGEGLRVQGLGFLKVELEGLHIQLKGPCCAPESTGLRHP